MARTVEPGRCYLMDRGYAKFLLWNVIHAADSSYVCRVRDNSVYEVIEEKPLTAADRKAGVISDLLEIPEELIAEAYCLRWLIDLFFRMFKQLPGCRHR